MKTKVLVIAVIKKGRTVLLRKKPQGAPPYKQTWYLFGGELTESNPDPQKVITIAVRKQTGVTIKTIQQLGWDTEIKKDLDGEQKLFIYLDYMCTYVSGKLRLSEGIEKLEWAPINQLKSYDLVPPSKKLFKKLGYL